MEKTIEDIKREYYTSSDSYVFLAVRFVLLIAGILAYYFQW